MGFLDYLFFGVLLNNFKNKLRNVGNPSDSRTSSSYNYDELYVSPEDLMSDEDDLGQNMFVEYEDPFDREGLYDDEELYDEDDLFEEDDLYDDELYYDSYDDDEFYDEYDNR